MFSLYCMSSPSLLLFLLFYSSISPPTSPLCFANLVLLILPPHLPFQYFGIFLFLSPYLLRSYTLFSSSSSAAECCPSYLCSRLGMFFLLMRSILSLPSHHLLFSVWASCVSYLSPLPILGYCHRFTGGGNGLEVGLCHDWLKSSIERVSGMLDVVWLGNLSISLSTQNNCWETASEAVA